MAHRGECPRRRVPQIMTTFSSMDALKESLKQGCKLFTYCFKVSFLILPTFLLLSLNLVCGLPCTVLTSGFEVLAFSGAWGGCHSPGAISSGIVAHVY